MDELLFYYLFTKNRISVNLPCLIEKLNIPLLEFETFPKLILWCLNQFDSEIESFSFLDVHFVFDLAGSVFMYICIYVCNAHA